MDDDATIAVVMGIDLGATFAKLGLVTLEGKATKSIQVPLEDRSATAVVSLLISTGASLLASQGKTWKDLPAIGIGCPGWCRHGVVVASANFPLWKDVPLAQLLQQATGTPTSLVNDADAAVSGEVWVGSAKGKRHAAMLTLGSGVGLGLVVDGKVVSGARGLVEGGHMLVQLNGRLCGCGQRGCLEAYSSANAVANRALEATTTYEGESSLKSIVLSQGGKITCQLVFEAAQAGDQLAQSIVQETATYLAMGCLNICRVVDPEVIIFAGGMTNSGDQLLNAVKESFKTLGWTILENKVDMVIASLGPETGLIGAAACARFLLDTKT